MPINQGTLVIASIRPNDSQDTYPTAHANELLGGLHALNTLTERNSISISRRQAGMLCNVLETNMLYQLGSDLTTWTAISIPYTESQTGRIDAIDDVPHHLISKARQKRTILKAYLYLQTGTCNVKLRINSVTLPGASAIAVSTTPIEVTFTSDNDVNVGDVVALDISSAVSAASLYFQVDYKVS